MHRFVETSGDVQQPESPRAEAEGLEDHQTMDPDPEITETTYISSPGNSASETELIGDEEAVAPGSPVAAVALPPAFPKNQPTLPDADEDDDPVLEEKHFDLEMKNIIAMAAKSESIPIESKVFKMQGFAFKMVIYPRGQGGPDKISGFVARVPSEEEEPASGHKVYTHFTMQAQSATDQRWNEGNYTFKCFKPKEDANWGYRAFTPIAHLMDPTRGFLRANDIIVFRVTMRLVKGSSFSAWDADDVNYDSKEATGMVGILNQGATCYMNSLLQTLFFTDAFLRGVFLMPTVPGATDNEANTAVALDNEKNVALAVQRLFYRLQTSPTAVETQELTRSFGWGGAEAFKQHDVQEFLRVLMDNIEEKMKSTKVAQLQSLVSNLFMAKMKSYIRCTKVAFESARTEDYYDVQLKVKGISNLLDSFQDYCSVEDLEGENQYQAEGHGLQDAKKGIIFQSFPAVLHLQLRRFEYDMELDESVKVNDRFDFPERMNLDKFLETPDPACPADYTLHSVLVQIGNVQYGHYVAFVQPDPESAQWYRFDDEHVRKCKSECALKQNFGGVDDDGRMSHSSAYMLVYMRSTQMQPAAGAAANIVNTASKRSVADIPPHLVEFFEQEAKDAVIKAKADEELARCRKLTVVTTKDIAGHAGPHILAGRSRGPFPTTTLQLQVERDATHFEVMQQVSANVNIPMERLKVFPFIMRENITYRPDKAIAADGTPYFAEVREKHCACMAIEFVRASTEPHPLHESDILLFFKKFDRATWSIKMIGAMVVPITNSPRDYLADVYHVGQMEKEKPLVCFEELEANKINGVHLDQTFEQSELQSGDILVFETDDMPQQTISTCEWYAQLANQVVVEFKEFGAPDDETKAFQLTLDKRATYDLVMEALADHLKTALKDPTAQARMLQLTAYDWISQCPDINRKISSLTDNLRAMFPRGGSNMGSEKILYYERLKNDIDFVETQTLLPDLSVMNFDDFTVTRRPYLSPPDATVADIIKGIVEEDKLDGTPEEYRLLQLTDDHTIHRVEDSDTTAIDCSYFKLRLERIPVPQLRGQTSSWKVLQVQHMFKTASVMHGTPFLIDFHQDEPIVDFKRKLRETVKVDEAEFDNWTIYLRDGLLDSGPLQVLNDDDNSDVLWQMPQCNVLLSHKLLQNKRRKRTVESAVKIHN